MRGEAASGQRIESAPMSYMSTAGEMKERTCICARQSLWRIIHLEEGYKMDPYGLASMRYREMLENKVWE